MARMMQVHPDMWKQLTEEREAAQAEVERLRARVDHLDGYRDAAIAADDRMREVLWSFTGRCPWKDWKR